MMSIKIKKFNELTKKQVLMIAKSNFNYWVKINPNLDFEQSTGAIIAMQNNTSLPIGLALFDNDAIIGFCTLRENRLERYPNINPWICNVFIFEQFQGKGYGKKLVDFACQKIKEMGFRKVYVWTDQAPDFYLKMGFDFEQKVKKNEGGMADLFSKKLQ